MTVQDASNLLFTWFEQSDSFEINRDIKKAVPIIDNEEETVIAFKLALESLEKMELIGSKEHGDKKYYILLKHMDSYQQNVEVGPWTAKFITNEINDFCNLVEDNTDLCQVTSITEKDVRNLAHIILFYKQKIAEKEQIISGSSDGSEQAVNDALLESFKTGHPLANKPPPDDEEEDPKKKKKKK